VGKSDKIKQDVLGGTSNANIRFDDLCLLLTHLGFKERTKGSHRIFSKSGIFEIINLQPRHDGKAKTYQVNQVRAIIAQHNL
jgi:predicted RNA binding protein YcfA (HicA-like mRNA interferase family)